MKPAPTQTAFGFTDLSAPHNGTPTSRAAAEEIRPASETLRQTVLEAICLRERYGATREELEAMTGLNGNTIRPRVAELLEQGLVVLPEGRTRKTKAGRQAAVLVGREFS